MWCTCLRGTCHLCTLAVRAHGSVSHRAAERPWGLGSSLVIPSLLDFAGPQPRLFPPPQGGFPSAHVSLARGLSSRRCAQGALCGAVAGAVSSACTGVQYLNALGTPPAPPPRERRGPHAQLFWGAGPHCAFPQPGPPMWVWANGRSVRYRPVLAHSCATQCFGRACLSVASRRVGKRDDKAISVHEGCTWESVPGAPVGRQGHYGCPCISLGHGW